jgi:HK97 family phage prohead protease
MRYKTTTAHVKAEGDGLAEGQFEAYVATYDRDSYGDRIIPGAFEETLKDWQNAPGPLPVLWSHRADDPDYHIGHVVEAEERKGRGLWVRGQLDLEMPKAKAVHRLLVDRRVTQFSFAYDVVDGSEAKADGEWEYELRKLKLYEVGPCLVGVNQETELINAKALRQVVEDMKAGRVLSAKNEGILRTAYEGIGTVLGALDKPEDEGKASGTAKAEEPLGAKAEELMSVSTYLEVVELYRLGLDMTEGAA